MTAVVPRSYLHFKQVISVRVKPEHESKEWKAATVLQQYARHAFPRSYVLDIGGRRISRNRVTLLTDPSEIIKNGTSSYLENEMQPVKLGCKT